MPVKCALLLACLEAQAAVAIGGLNPGVNAARPDPDPDECPDLVAERRLNGQTARWFSRRSATQNTGLRVVRGLKPRLKPAATIGASLREAGPLCRGAALDGSPAFQGRDESRFEQARRVATVENGFGIVLVPV